MLNKAILLSAAGLLLAALPAVAKPKPAAVQTAVIENTGSTNTSGYTIKISTRGKIQYHTGDDSPLGPRVPFVPIRPLPRSQTIKLFQDLSAAMPLTNLPTRHGIRSASFGTRTYVTYKGQKSPDLTFASDPRTAALKSDIDAITKTLPIGNAPRRPVVIMRKVPFIHH